MSTRVIGMKTLKIAVLCCLIVLAGALLAVMVGVPAGFVVGALQNRVEAETGYRLRVAGPSTVALWPSPALTVRDMTLLDPKGADPLGTLTAASMRISLSLSSLLAGRPHISEISFARPILRLPLLRQRSHPAGNASPRSGSGLPVSVKNIPADRVSIEDGTVVLSNASDHFESRIQGILLTASLSGLGGPPSFKAQGQWDDQTFRIEMKANETADIEKGQPGTVKWAFEAPGLLQDPLSGVASIKVTGSTLTLNGLNGTSSQSPFTGWVSVDFASKPLLKAELAFQRLTLGAQTSNAGATGLDGNQPWSDRKVKIGALNYFDADIQIRGAEFTVDKVHFAPFSVQARVLSGVLKAEFPQFGLYDGQGNGVLIIDASDAVPVQALRLDLRGLHALPLLIDVADFNAIDGLLQAKIEIHATGASQRAVLSTLGGSADIRIEDGEIRGINVAKMIRALAANPLTGWQETKDEKTDLSKLSALFLIKNGQAATDNLQFAGPLVRVTGTGFVNIAEKTLSFRLEPKLTMSLEGQGGSATEAGLGVPVIVQGNWTEPHIYPDIGGILDDPADAYAKLRALGKGLFGGTTSPRGSGADTLKQGLENLFGPSTDDR
ncbi:MAG TPA: AsmA family protein [Methylocella sp.]|nr:AsmA family protein [Methylocella sp.]